MSTKSTRNCNGEGTTFYTVQKVKRKNFLPKECIICRNCQDRSACNNRQGYEKCDKCKNCKVECLKYCDRFYCRGIWQSQLSINGKRVTVANESRKKSSTDKKIEIQSQVKTNSYIQKNDVKLIDVIKNLGKTKFEAGKISRNTKSKDKYHYNYIENWEDFNKPVQKVTYQNVQDFLNSIRHLSQGEIEKIRDKLKAGFLQCVMDKIIAYPDNPMLRVYTPISFQIKKRVEAFELDEQRKLVEYIRTHTLIKSTRCNYDEKTLKNLFICGILTACRIGELGAIDIDKQIDLKRNELIINRTLTCDDGKIIMGTITKTGAKKIQQGLVDERYIPFNIFDKKLMLETITEQIEVARNNPNNTENLLFCQLDGKYIDHRCLNNIFKRICREAGVKLNLKTGCHIHMLRHTATTRMIEAGTDILVIAQILGHVDDRQIKETYGHILKDYTNKQLKNARKYYENQKLSI